MPHALDRISAEDTRLLMRKRARWNIVIALALAAFGLLVYGRVSPVIVVALAAGAGFMLGQ